MKSLIKKIQSLREYKDLVDGLLSGQSLFGLALPRSARLPVLAALHNDTRSPILLITDRSDHALRLFDELSFWAPSVVRFIYSEPTPLYYENAAWANSTRQERLQTLGTLARYHLPYVEKPSQHPIIVASARAVMTKSVSRRDWLKACKLIGLGNKYLHSDLIANWLKLGYEMVDTVLEPGQFSHRGGLLDLWVPGENHPIRLDFYGEELDGIRRFDPGTQRTIEKVENVLVIPAREFFLPEARRIETQYCEFHIPLLHKYPSTILDYLPQNTIILVDDYRMLEATVNDIEEQAVRSREECLRDGLVDKEFPVPYVTWGEIVESIQSRRSLELGRSTARENDGQTPLSALFLHTERFAGRLEQFIDHLCDLSNKGDEIVVVSRQASRLDELFSEKCVETGNNTCMFLEGSLSEGWRLERTCLITDAEIFGWTRPQRRYRPALMIDSPEAIYSDLNPGDWVVHVDYGIGRYVGLVQRTLDGLDREFLCVEYRNGDQVFVPVHQADRLTRYIGPDGGAPRVDSLGTQEWQEAKRKVMDAVKDVAEELLDLYAARQTAKGFAFAPDTAWQGELEASFPYVETDDQKKALCDIKKDMEQARPMDRLLCGDVGYGKTEVALRAAFKAVMNGKQVAVLVPTTVLAQQHYDTFRNRLSVYPVTVEMLSRFRSPREQNQILFALEIGAVDIIIGTHRLISNDVKFKELGLVIIDEEQRFGVTHKEHLKKIRNEVDVLTLTATPIPRTLYMALTGLRDISNLFTPPDERQPIITHIGPYSPALVRQAVIREIERGGQIFFVHNRVQTIDAMKMHLEKLVPEARISIAHGQMDEHELGSVMHRFTDGDVDLLLSTSIIESGLDIPNANTLIVDRADAFGLAQLYQLRGRVGRGASRAYAYFFKHNKLHPTAEGQERLEVIAENTQLGAGYAIAMRDLEMRGAGELLGIRQSGHIATVGFHLYTRLLASAVQRVRLNKGLPLVSEPMKALTPVNVPVNVDLPIAMGIPADYIHDMALRLRLYRRIADISDEKSLDALRTEFSDRFGPLPEMVTGLFYQMRVKMYAEQAGLLSVSMESGQILLRYASSTEDNKIPRLPDINPQVRGGRNAYWCKFGKDDDWQEKLLSTLIELRTRVHD